MFSKAILTAAAVGLVTVGVINAAPLTNDELQALKLINDARLEMAIPALIWDPNLQEDANMWAGDVANHGFLEHAPESQRNGADELLSFFHSVDKTSIQLRNPIRESAKMWLESNDSESSVKNSWERLSLTGKLTLLTTPLLLLIIASQSSCFRPRPLTSDVPASMASTERALPTRRASTLSAVFAGTSIRMFLTSVNFHLFYVFILFLEKLKAPILQAPGYCSPPGYQPWTLHR